jgi:long-chain acyl-CoA synthetase
MMILIVLAVLVVYLFWVMAKLGFIQRIPLALGKISLEQIPVRAAKMYGDKKVVSTDLPTIWCVPQIAAKNSDPYTWSANRINDTCGYVASLLRDEFGVERGDRIAILKTNQFDYHVLTASAVRAGGIGCPLHADFIADKVKPYLNNLGAKLIIVDIVTIARVLREGAELGDNIQGMLIVDNQQNANPAEVEEVTSQMQKTYPHIKFAWVEEALSKVKNPVLPIPRGEEEPLYMTHTSGTTGFPKAVILKNGGQSHSVRGMLAFSAVSRQDRGYLAVPFNHQAALASFNSFLLLGGHVHWTSYCKFDFNPKAALETIAREKFTAFFGFPITYTQLAAEDLDQYDLSSMRIWACTADACHEVIQTKFSKYGSFFRQLFIPIDGAMFIDAQGSSEVGTPSLIRYITTLSTKFERRIGKPGAVPFGPKVKVVNKLGESVKKGEVGRLVVKGKTVTEGYWNNHTKTYKETCDRWFFTGDVVRQEADGHIIQLDREVDVIRSAKGEVYSLLIEEKIHKHPAIFDACVYGMRQKDGTQEPAIVVALNKGVEIQATVLRSELNNLLSPLEQLHDLKIIPWRDFPVGLTGKTLKRVFREATEFMPTIEDNRPVGA